MRRNRDAGQLRDILAVRELQRLAAETRAAAAASDLRQKDASQAQCETERAAVEQDWLASVNAPSLCLETTRSWSAALLQQEQDLRSATREVVQAQAELERCATDWHAAEMRRDTAADMTARALADARRRNDEQALQDILDRNVAGGRQT